MEARGQFGMESIGDGVLGYTVDTEEALYVPLIIAVKAGTGAVGQWLDQLAPERIVRVPDVMSPKLRGMLERRGFEPKMEYAAEFDEEVEVYERQPREKSCTGG